MKGILLLNGQPYRGAIDADGAVVYCCDGAYEWAHGSVRIDKNVGDFDSLSYLPDPPPEEIYPAEKDFTDGEIALRKMLSAGVTDVEIYGGGGGREDHFLGNLQLLYYCASRGVTARMVNDNSLLFAATGKIALGKFRGCTFSVLPFGERLHIIESGGCKYAYPDFISLGECRGVSNVVQGDDAFVAVEGCALVIINRGKV